MRGKSFTGCAYTLFRRRCSFFLLPRRGIGAGTKGEPDIKEVEDGVHGLDVNAVGDKGGKSMAEVMQTDEWETS